MQVDARKGNGEKGELVNHLKGGGLVEKGYETRMMGNMWGHIYWLF